MELVDPDVHASKIQCMPNLWVKQLSSVVNRTACRSIIAGAASLVDSVNASSGDALTSVQRDDHFAANSFAATYYDCGTDNASSIEVLLDHNYLIGMLKKVR